MNTETVLVTGASSGIGLELAKCFAAEKCDLILTARNRDALEKLAVELRREHGIKVEIIIADLSQPESPQKIISEIKGRGISVDVLVNNAGFGLHGAFSELPLKRQLEIVQVNIAALVELTGLFLPDMLRRNRGGILNVGSVAGFVPGPHMAVYYASKAFVLSFSESLHEELRGTKIQVTNLCPGPTESNFSNVARSHRARQAQAKKMSAAEVARIGHRDFRAGVHISLPGVINKISAFAPRVFPRGVVRRLIGRYNKLK
ncbi:MAG TPA: SDR family oxidoreductase [Candidatus Sulfotelmatobacter sp.]|jgi:short-subunit dehydrogenase|nr:SDR family oxidoreductase [Candidatus Sulfotelmatobacter sp.]